MTCPWCQSEVCEDAFKANVALADAARVFGAAGGRAGRGKVKARTSEQARKAAEARWGRTSDGTREE